MKKAIGMLVPLLFVFSCSQVEESSSLDDVAIVEGSEFGLSVKAVIFRDPETSLVYLSKCDVDSVFSEPTLCRDKKKLIPGTDGIEEREFYIFVRRHLRDKMRYRPVLDEMIQVTNIRDSIPEKREMIERLEAEISELQVRINTLSEQIDPALEQFRRRFEEDKWDKEEEKRQIESDLENIFANYGSLADIDQRIDELRGETDSLFLSILEPSEIATSENEGPYLENLDIVMADADLFGKIRFLFKMEISFSNYIWTEDGIFYATLDDHPIDFRESGCQVEFMSIPDGWELAPRTPQTTRMVLNNYWGTDFIVFEDGIAIKTLLNTTSRIPLEANSLSWHPERVEYKPESCDKRILVMKTISNRL